MTRLNNLQGHVFSLFRVVVGLLFLSHGAASLFGVLGGAHPKGGTVAFATWPSWWAAAIQFVGGGMVLLGLGTRIAAVICSGSMAYAYFVVHADRALVPIENGGEASAMFCWAFLLIAFLGAGPLSLDFLISRSRLRGGQRVGTA